MNSLKTLLAVSTLVLLTACAGAGRPGYGPRSAVTTPPATPTAPMAAMQDRMKTLQAMHDKMMNAKTPAERQALMAEHMKAMQEGMESMRGMKGMGGMGGMGGMKGMGMGGMGQGMPADPAQRQQMMEMRMDMMQTMMEMMMQRMPGAAAPAPAK